MLSLFVGKFPIVADSKYDFANLYISKGLDCSVIILT